ncbi:putative transferase CAF17 homolog, mitochondrial [Procambarus clarkii]|uniref:putative transferase CAF17 homolog, mitochondrial n=1 Tax=Procambarus clarkii TaxID=6728 RepID=UPI001E676D4E|nr:putative transferase CAF17 homolog, mitochondrial [Procambarus clarkii]XP_045588384.1 putative transferase CAF17 homolog, mitochondrial [Procambarus clarkii]XP_045588389.1 putative transferase CAF17 homolog, mitochondrial [Procambarus clarkii]XP_045588395.1 putative transferase CAF17 homolog, mitochondrial [Procambarus clarkii]XP_045588401.1 putative transferase CAF17 homolog, mitochondrial [Procambarus clarkii]XP_045588408.1 putative transferase CAF17 homolog, mitochondrial [Procambarus cl
MFRILGYVCHRKLVCGTNLHRTSRLAVRQLHGEPQRHRSLVQIQGTEAAEFLQGLITNDINHLEDGAKSMYSMLLNTQGRVLFDTIIYRKDEKNFIVESDNDRVIQLVRHLRMYRVRRKIDIDCIDDDYHIWCVFDPDLNFKDITHVNLESLYMNPRGESEALLEVSNNVEDVIITRDPRMKYLGHRVIVPSNGSIDDILPSIQHGEAKFMTLRYRLGVGEGMVELPPTKCLPLEANCDYLHGVSFHKGCYIGQELTARTFHTGVVRKRYMPLIFSGDATDVSFDASIVNEKGKSVGKVRGCEGQYGIGLLRIEECLEAKSLMVNDVPVSTFKPAWWPYEASKERMN